MDQAQELPYLLTAADNHNYGNGNFALTDPTTWGTGLSNSGKLIVSSMASGLNSFYNTAVWTGNLFTDDRQQAAYRDTGVWLGQLDSSLEQYYNQNRESADLAGFIVTSFVPGVGGVKLLNAGTKVLNTAVAEGRIGANFTRATGLLRDVQADYVTLAAQDIIKSQAGFSAISGNLTKGILQGYGRNALEAAAFEVAVAASMHRSPILSEMDISDLGANIALGVAVGGVIGGSFAAAGKYFGMKNQVIKAGDELQQYKYIHEIPNAPADFQISNYLQQIADVSAFPPKPGLSDVALRLSEERIKSLKLKVREKMHSLAIDGDSELSNMLTDGILVGAEGRSAVQVMSHMKQFGRLGDTLAVEKQAESLAARGETLKSSKAIEKNLQKQLDLDVQYVKLTGEDAGKIFDDLPTAPKVADVVQRTGGKSLQKDVEKFVARQGYKPSMSNEGLGDMVDSVRADGRYIYANSLPQHELPKVVSYYDIPMLERLYLQEQRDSLTIRFPSGEEVVVMGKDKLFNTILQAKEELALELNAAGKKGDEVAAIVNVKKSRLNGELDSDPGKDIFARQYFNEQYTNRMIASGFAKQTDGILDTALLPSVAKLAYNTKGFREIDGNIVRGVEAIATMQKRLQGDVDHVIAHHAPQFSQELAPIPQRLMLGANQFGSNAGFASAINGNPGTLESYMQYLGSVTNRMRLHFKTESTEVLNPPFSKLLVNTEAALETSIINNQLAGYADRYVFDATGTYLMPKKLKEYYEGIRAGKQLEDPKLQEGIPHRIDFKTAEARNALAAHIERNGQRVSFERDLRASTGYTNYKNADVYYPIKPDPKDFQHHAMVYDDTVTGVGHVSMIHAADPEKLQVLSLRAKELGLRVEFKGDTEAYFKAYNNYQYERTLHENYVDTALVSRGINTQTFPATDPQKIVNEMLNWHKRQDDVLAREVVDVKYAKEFAELENLGAQYDKLSTSKYKVGSKEYENAISANPYLNYIKTAKDISQASESSLISGFNRVLESAYSTALHGATDLFQKASTQAEVDAVNQLLTEKGIKSGYYDAATILHANHTAPKNELLGFVRTVNSALATVVLRLDFLNPIVNAISSNILLGTEVKSLLRNIVRDDTAVGKAFNIRVPGQEIEIPSATKLLGNAYSNFFNPELRGVLQEGYKKLGWDTTLIQQMHSMVDDMTLTGKESVKELLKKKGDVIEKAKAFGELGEKVTGNRWAEEFNRFIAADVGRQITEIGMKNGTLELGESLAFINTFVNRTQGNMLASQRPLMFQGAAGQAIGLFQTYQFNFMQQLFRYVGEGTAKDTATLLGLQGTIFGMNGLPAFNFINQHIVGSASGNKEHRDLYDATYGIAGKTAADWLMYGLPSNMMQTNLYTRGDINPRHPTIIPVNPVDIPIIAATGRFVGNLLDAAKRLGNGAPLGETFLQALEHNSLNRPLAGLAQVAQGLDGGYAYSTSGKGTIMGANDLYSFSSLSRLAGGKPIQEALLNDEVYRIQAYSSADRKKKLELAEAAKVGSIGTTATPDVGKFAEKYLALGGSQQDFNKWMIKQMKEANTSKVNDIANSLKTPFAQKMQLMLGGESYQDSFSPSL